MVRAGSSPSIGEISWRSQDDAVGFQHFFDALVCNVVVDCTPFVLVLVAHAARDDLIMATGRSDYPNQVNNVLGFPFIFRGALDVRASCINTEMQIAAVNALANLAREPVPAEVLKAYDKDKIEFGAEYIIPKPFDPRLQDFVPKAVSDAALETGVVKKK